MPRAGLAPASVTEAGADLADEIGYEQLSIGLLAKRLGVKTPSLYKHVDGQSDLAHRIAILAVHEIADAIRDATQGRAGRDALVAGAHAMRRYVLDHPGRFAAANAARTHGPDDPLVPATGKMLESWRAMLHGYHLEPHHEIHALRMLRSLLNGFATVEAGGGFQIDRDVDESFTWIIGFIDHGLTSLTQSSTVQPGSTEEMLR